MNKELLADMAMGLVYIFTPFLVFVGIVAVLNSCTVTYDADDKACLIHFSPTGKQIQAIGEQCRYFIERVHAEPEEVVLEDDGI